VALCVGIVILFYCLFNL